MIQLLDSTKTMITLLMQLKDFSIESDLATADKLLHFLIPRQVSPIGLIQEHYLRTETDEFVIKEVNRVDRDFLEVFAKLNLDSLRGRTLSTYESIERPVSLVLTDILFGTGWTFQLIDSITKSRTIRQKEASVLAILQDCAKTYSLEYWFDTLTKTVNVYQTRGQDRGAYVYTDLNLKSSELQADTYDLITRIYPYGADGLTIASVNSGLEYIDNNTFSEKIVETIWVDERYMSAQALFDDATALLAEFAVPRSSFFIDVINLKGASAIYNFLDFQLGDTVKILDRDNQLITTQRIVKLKEYPLTPEKNRIEFSNKRVTFTDSNKQQFERIDSSISRVKTELSDAIERVSNIITNSESGYVVTRYNNNSEPYEILIMDTDNVATATKVWRWNGGGLGFSSTGYNGLYTTAITQDGRIVANFITAGTLDAAVVRSGILQSVDGSSWLNLADGTFSFGEGRISFLNDVFRISAGTAELDGSGTTLQEALDNKADQSALDTLNQYMTFSQSFGLSLGQVGSPFQIAISNTEMDFKQNGSVIAYINGQKMYITDVDIMNSLEVGNHKIRKFDTNNTIVEYVG